MGWLRWVGSIKLQVSFVKEPCKRDNILQKRPVARKLHICYTHIIPRVASYAPSEWHVCSKVWVSSAKKPYKKDNILQKRPVARKLHIFCAHGIPLVAIYILSEWHVCSKRNKMCVAWGMTWASRNISQYDAFKWAALWCSVSQCVAVCRSVLQVSQVTPQTTYSSVLQCVAVCRSVLQCVAVCCNVSQCVAVCCSVLQCVAVCCRCHKLRHKTTHS